MHNKKDKLLSFILVSPSILAVLVFVYGFIAWTARVSMSQWKGLTPDYTFVGLSNYLSLLNDARFLIDVRNTLIFSAFFLAGAIGLGLVLAVILDQGLKGESLFRGIFLFPMSISYIVTGVVWKWLMNPAAGARISGLNLLFTQLHLDFLVSSWHTTPYWGIAFLTIPAIWQMSGYMMALYLAGLRAIPDTLREAARVDGANEWQVLRYVVLPLLTPITLSAVVITGHMSLKVFDLIVAVAGKQLALDMPAINMWQSTFDGNLYGSGAAIGIILLVSVAGLIVPYIHYTRKAEGSQ